MKKKVLLIVAAGIFLHGAVFDFQTSTDFSDLQGVEVKRLYAEGCYENCTFWIVHENGQREKTRPDDLDDDTVYRTYRFAVKGGAYAITGGDVEFRVSKNA